MGGEFRLPPGYTLYPGTCMCGRALLQVDEIEGQPVYACANRCGQERPLYETRKGEEGEK